MTGMTKAERDALGALIRKREKVLKHHAAQRSAELLAEFDAQSAKIHHFDDDAVWAEATRTAQAAVEAARIQVAARCQELGIPVEFAPTLSFSWSGRGQNAWAERRVELRRAAKSRIEAIEATAIAEIEQMSLQAQTQVIAHGLESEAAKKFLEAMPAISTLMPTVAVDEIQQLVETRRRADKQRYLLQ